MTNLSGAQRSDLLFRSLTTPQSTPDLATTQAPLPVLRAAWTADGPVGREKSATGQMRGRLHPCNQRHIINMSPPFDLTMVPGRIAYAISKLGMTLLTHGLAEEVRPHHIAVNSLWPVTIIESQASINWGLGTREAWRKPDILVDCVLRLVRKDPGEITGLALLDEDLLRSEGVTDFGGYACVPGTNPPRLTWPAFRT